MNNKELKEYTEVLQEILKASMHEAIDVMWDRSEEDLMNSLEIVFATPDDEKRPSSFTMMQITGLIGVVLVAKHKKDEKELMKMLKDSDALFIKEILNEQEK